MEKKDIIHQTSFFDLEEVILDADVAVLFVSVKNIVFVSVRPCYLAAICQRPPKRVGRDSSFGIVTCYGMEVQGSNPGGVDIFRTRPEWPWGPSSLLYNRYRVFLRSKGGQSMSLIIHPI